MLARNQYLLSTYGNQVSDELTTGGVKNNHYAEGFVFMSLESTSCSQVILDGLKLDGVDVRATPYVIIDSEISFRAGPTTDAESLARPLSSSNTISSSQEYTFDCTATYNVAYTVGGVNYELIVKDLAISFSSGTSFSDRRRSMFQQFVEHRGSWSTPSFAIRVKLEVRRSTGSRVRR